MTASQWYWSKTVKITSKILALCGITAILCGLSGRFEIKVLQEAHSPPLFVFGSQRHPPSRGGVEINSFLVVKKNQTGKWDYESPVWAFGLAPGSSSRLSKVEYAHVPDGFNEATKATELVRGVSYLAVGLSPGLSGSEEFIEN
jgi:hypothetical protein